MEINALFDLWDQFANITYTDEGETNEQFYSFPPGTNVNEILNWFHHQNPYFEIGQEKAGDNIRLVAFCNPKRDA